VKLGFSGDGGPASSALLSYPSGVALDGGGSLYIADTYNGRVREVSSSGIISTIAGNGVAQVSGDGGQAGGAGISEVRAIARDDAGNLYVADACLGHVRRISPGGNIAIVAGAGGGIGSLGDGGQAVSAQIGCAWSLALDSFGNLYISDIDHNLVRKVSSAGVITTVAGAGSAGYSGDGGPAAGAHLNAPVALAADKSGNLFIADAFNNRIRMVSAAGIITTVAGTGVPGYSGDGGPAADAQFGVLSGLTIDSAGNLYAADQSYNVVRLLRREKQ
jgi:sugar lactone lactonase YvrE